MFTSRPDFSLSSFVLWDENDSKIKNDQAAENIAHQSSIMLTFSMTECRVESVSESRKGKEKEVAGQSQDQEKKKNKKKEKKNRNVSFANQAQVKKSFPDFNVFPKALNAFVEAFQLPTDTRSKNAFSADILKSVNVICKRIQNAHQGIFYTMDEMSKLAGEAGKIAQYNKKRKNKEEIETNEGKDALAAQLEIDKTSVGRKRYANFIAALDDKDNGVFQQLKKSKSANVKKELEELENIWQSRSPYAHVPSESLKELMEKIDNLEIYVSLLTQYNYDNRHEVKEEAKNLAQKLTSLIEQERSLIIDAILERLALIPYLLDATKLAEGGQEIYQEDDVVIRMLEDLLPYGLNVAYLNEAKQSGLPLTLTKDLILDFNDFILSYGNEEQKNKLFEEYGYHLSESSQTISIPCPCNNRYLKVIAKKFNTSFVDLPQDNEDLTKSFIDLSKENQNKQSEKPAKIAKEESMLDFINIKSAVETDNPVYTVEEGIMLEDYICKFDNNLDAHADIAKWKIKFKAEVLKKRSSDLKRNFEEICNDTYRSIFAQIVENSEVESGWKNIGTISQLTDSFQLIPEHLSEISPLLDDFEVIFSLAEKEILSPYLARFEIKENKKTFTDKILQQMIDSDQSLKEICEHVYQEFVKERTEEAINRCIANNAQSILADRIAGLNGKISKNANTFFEQPNQDNEENFEAKIVRVCNEASQEVIGIEIAAKTLNDKLVSDHGINDFDKKKHIVDRFLTSAYQTTNRHDLLSIKNSIIKEIEMSNQVITFLTEQRDRIKNSGFKNLFFMDSRKTKNKITAIDEAIQNIEKTYGTKATINDLIEDVNFTNKRSGILLRLFGCGSHSKSKAKQELEGNELIKELRGNHHG